MVMNACLLIVNGLRCCRSWSWFSLVLSLFSSLLIASFYFYDPKAVFEICRNNHWTSCLNCLQQNPRIGVTTMIMVRLFGFPKVFVFTSFEGSSSFCNSPSIGQSHCGKLEDSGISKYLFLRNSHHSRPYPSSSSDYSHSSSHHVQG